jgi:glucose-6-phosphate isomerase
MPLPHNNPTELGCWERLNALSQQLKQTTLTNLFSADPGRARKLSIEWEDFFVDFSKHLVTDQVMGQLYELAHEAGLSEAKSAYLSGAKINVTEDRAVLHTALRSQQFDPKVDGKSVDSEVSEVKARMAQFCSDVLTAKRRGYSGKAFTDVVNIGIGGSDLGPVMVTEALAFYRNHLNVHFVSNVDGDHVQEVLKKLNPETTLFLVVSKSFTTQETLANATTCRNWFLTHAGESDVALHFAAVSTNLSMTTTFGISEELVFPMADWVGGRFSLWSAVGLSIALSIGFERFEELLEGAALMDKHFATAEDRENIPLNMALLGIWYTNFLDAETECIIPYTQYLHRFSAYLQQAVMESNGKYVSRSGEPVSYQTGSIVWGEPGTNSQHAFFQLIHQGTKLIPCDFIGFANPLYGDLEHHDKLMSNFFAQTEALMNGKTKAQVVEEFAVKGISETEASEIIPHKVFEGNRPTTTFLIDKLTPKTLGALIAAYEHKIFIQGVIWNIYSYDQWGVELGKQLANQILSDWQNGSEGIHDPSTLQLLKRFKNS